MTSTIDDGRIRAGMTRQIAIWRDLIREGHAALGWKVGFGAPAAMKKLNLTAPLIGYLLAKNALSSESYCSVKGWTKPVAEPEIAIHLGNDLPAGSSLTEARAAIVGIGPAIELADLCFEPEDPERILAENIYQRHVIIGAPDLSRAGAALDGLVGRILVNGSETHLASDLEANTGRLVAIVRHVADTLGAMNEQLNAGQVIIAGSVVAPIFVTEAHREISFELSTIGRASIRLLH